MSKEEKARRRALAALQAGRCFHARGSTNKALLDKIRDDVDDGPSAAASSSRKKRARPEQNEDIPAAPLSGEGEEEAEKEEKEEPRPEATALAARAPAERAESFASRRTWQRGPRRRSPSRGESRRLLCRRPGSKTM